MLSTILSNILFTIIKVLIWIYSIVTLPIHLLVDWPFGHWVRKRPPLTVRVSHNRWKAVQDPKSSDPFKGIDTVAQLLASCAAKYGSKRCIGTRRVLSLDQEKSPDARFVRKQLADEYSWTSFADFELMVQRVMHGFSVHGVKQGDKVLLALETRAEWLTTAVSLMRMGVTVCTVYSTSGVDGVVHAVSETSCSHLVTNSKICKSLLKVRDRVEGLQKLVVVEDPLIEFKVQETEGLDILTFRQVEEDGGKNMRDLGSKSFEPETPIKGSDVALIMYTSGTTGVPKGVLFSQRSFVSAISVVRGLVDAPTSGPRLRPVTDVRDLTTGCHFAYLPAAHIMELTMEFLTMCLGSRIGFGSPFTAFSMSPGLLPGTRCDTHVLNPTFTVMVPLVGERIKSNVCDQVSKKPLIIQKLFHWSLGYKSFWNSMHFSTPITDRVMFGQTRVLFGSRVQSLAVGGAAMTASTQSFLRSVLCCPVLLGYGTTETFALTSIQSEWETGTDCGHLYPGTEIMLQDWEEGGYRSSDQPNPRGELVVGGRFVSSGYYNREEETKENYFKDPEDPEVTWFKTGDVAEVDDKTGVVRIIDRKKDLVKLMNGEFVALGQLESLFKGCPFASNLVVHASSRLQQVILIVVPEESAVSALVEDDENQNIRKDLSSLCRDPRVIQAIEESISQIARDHQLSRSQTPGKVILVADQWTPENGLATASLKNRRKQLTDKYNDLIQQAITSS